jgi:hypothetical protein
MPKDVGGPVCWKSLFNIPDVQIASSAAGDFPSLG